MQSKAIEVIRHSLAAASAALSLLETESPVSQEITVVEAAAPVVVELVEEAAAPVVVELVEEVAALVEPASSGPDLRFVALMNELDGRYALRTVGELEDKLGLTYTQMTTKLEDEGVEFVTRTRRSDSALLIGLASRN